jgi:energy-converting hydrogenase A subunit E
MTPEFIIGLGLILLGTVSVTWPSPKDYLTRLINLEIPAFGLLLVMLSFNEMLALMTFVAVATISTFIFVRVIGKRGAVN